MERTLSIHTFDPGFLNSEGQGYSPNNVHQRLIRYLYTSPWNKNNSFVVIIILCARNIKLSKIVDKMKLPLEAAIGH